MRVSAWQLAAALQGESVAGCVENERTERAATGAMITDTFVSPLEFAGP